MKIKLRFESVVFLLLLGYLAFIPTGPFPIYVISGLRLDVAFGFLLSGFVAIYFGRIKKYPDILVLTWLFYCFIILLSTILSVNIELSASNSVVIFGYSIIALLVPVIFVDRADIIRKWVFLIGVLVSLLILYLYIVLGFGHSHRFALSVADVSAGAGRDMGLAVVDPNMTAAGLALALIVYFPKLFDSRKRIVPDLLGALCILLAVILTLSRSAMLGFILSVLFPFLMVFVSSLNLNKLLVWKRKIFVSFLVSLIAVPCVVFLGHFIFPQIVDKLIDRIVRSSEDSARISLLVNAWDVFMTNIKTVVIGSGFMTTNPHNEYMRTLSSMGLLGVLGAIGFHAAMFYFSIKILSRNYRMMFSALSIIVFIMTISLFYGYTKLIWVAWMFLLLLYREGFNSSHIGAARAV